jgi:ClpP class serine protease
MRGPETTKDTHVITGVDTADLRLISGVVDLDDQFRRKINSGSLRRRRIRRQSIGGHNEAKAQKRNEIE